MLCIGRHNGDHNGATNMKAFAQTTTATPLTADAILRNNEVAEAHVIAHYNDMLAADGLEVMGDTTAEVAYMPRVKSEANAERYAAAGYESTAAHW